jgi:hypothetical protein
MLALFLGGVAALAVARPAFAEDEEPATDSGPRLRLYGFGDVNMLVPLTHATMGENHGTAYVGNLNVYLDAQITSRFRTLSEIRFTYLPSGDQSTLATDYNGQNRATWGGIVIERAWVEYAARDLLTVRVGEFLTPYGIWNVDHGSPTLLTVWAPKLITGELFPKQQVGLEVYGSRYFKDVRLGYHLTVSNGRIGSNPAFSNKNGRAAFGGRLFAETSAVGNLRIGVSAYNGRYAGYGTHTTYVVDPNTNTATPISNTMLTEQYDETSFAGDVSWSWNHLSFNAEVVGQNQKPTKAGAAAAAMIHNPFAGSPTDRLMVGAYGTLAYELPWYGITPWGMIDVLRWDTKESGTIQHMAAGLTVRALPALVVKGQFSHIVAKDLYFFPKVNNQLMAQVAYAF